MSAAVSPITLETYPLATGFGLDPDSFVEQMFSNGKVPAYPRSTVELIAQEIAARSREFSDDGRSVAGQIAHETNFLRYTGDSQPYQYNFGGIGTTGGGVHGESYAVIIGYDENGKPIIDVPASVKAGVLAMFTHRSAYMRGKKENWPTDLQQYWGASHREQHVVAAGFAGTVHQQKDFGNGKWAVGPLYNVGITNAANLFRADSGGSMPRVLKLAIGAGHHNSSGGNATEKALTGPLTKQYVDTARAWGVDVRCYTPNDGLGDYPGNLGAAVREVQGWANNGWVADMLVEVHFQGLAGNSNAGRGVFVIYPDWTNDLDTDIRDRLRPLYIQEFTARTGMPAYGDGGMSEKRTAVGAAGDRLGVFSQSVGLKATTSRTIIEHGCHTCPADKAIITAPGFNQKAVDAFFHAWFKMENVPLPGPTPEPLPPGEYVPSGYGESFTNQWNGHSFYVIGPFFDEVEKLGDEFYPTYGLIASGMVRVHVDGILRYVQFTERGAMACYPSNLPHGAAEGDPWFIRNLLPKEREIALREAQGYGWVYPELE